MASVHPIAPYTGGFEITFMHMGQGDCCLIRCPDDEIILIDCGSSKGFDEDVRARAALTLRKYCTGGPVHSLILTHADRDHYNCVKGVIGSVKFDQNVEFEFDGKTKDFPWTPVAVGVQRVYFSDMSYATAYRTGGKEFNDYADKLNDGPLHQYYTSMSSDFLYRALEGQRQINLVHLDGNGPGHVRSWTWNNANRRNAAVERAPNGKLAGQAVENVHAGTGWSVDILAGDVAKSGDDKSDSDGCNAASLVTLLQIGNRKCLICGDATVSTEAVLLKIFGAAISGVEILQAPHHGSGLTSSSPLFVAKTAPHEVVMSVARLETGYHLPGLEVVQSYRNITAQLPNGETVVVDGWIICKGYVKGRGGTPAYIKADEFVNKYGVKPDNGLYCLSDEDIAKLLKGASEPVCIAVMPALGYMLYREAIGREVYQTGLEGPDPFIVLKLGP